MKKCPFRETDRYIRKKEDIVGYTVKEAVDCLEDNCALWDEYQLCCGLKVTMITSILAK